MISTANELANKLQFLESRVNALESVRFLSLVEEISNSN